MSKTQCEVEILVRGAHDQIIAGLMQLDVGQLRQGLEWSRANYGKLDIERLLEMAIELHEDAGP
ncbi:MAG: hypothetical protein EVA61_00180 [Litorivicinaceae bacterium]|nr:hypothetical protein [Gammaproteobacteria bacterium]RPG21046.1 MAG: hypothetical protein CBB93_004810 [Oceanospirillales bacterium TMED33]RZO78045.1 MAG: hypothetical protein EVA61_00180 [Litorivicinaceae bacterium]CAI8371267.1 MAG: Uncharacterised protein [Gammaproteobacteria bacterium]